jgi:hypothetical protein
MIIAILFVTLICLLFPQLMRLIAVLLWFTFIYLVVSLAARAETGCETLVVTDAIITKGSIACDANWTDAPVVVAMTRQIRSDKCYGALGVDKFMNDVRRGTAGWDHSVRELGYSGACQKLAETVRQMSKQAHMKDPPSCSCEGDNYGCVASPGGRRNIRPSPRAPTVLVFTL